MCAATQETTMTAKQRTLPAQERRDPAMNQQTQAAPQQPPATNGGQSPGDGEFQRLLAQDSKRTVYIPLGEQDEVTLNLPVIQRYFSNPTRSGAMPSEPDIRKFIMICKQRRLNPWAGDCFLLGYDTKHGPKFSVIVAQQAILKRAEISPQFDGMESGIVVERNGEIIERPGDLTMDGEKLLGGWAAVYRKDRGKAFYQRLKLQTYQRGTQQWDSDAAGMIVKCSESGALRQAFPSDVGGLYLEQEIRAGEQAPEDTQPTPKPQSAAAQLNARLGQPKEPVKEAVVGTAAPTESQESPPEGSTEGGTEGGTATEGQQETGDENQGREEDEQAEGND